MAIPLRPHQAVLDCVLLRYREAPAPNELVELVQVGGAAQRARP